MASNRQVTAYLFGECELLPDRQELIVGSDVQTIPPQIYALLHYLIENRDRLVTRDELNAHIWDGRAVSDASLSTCIKLARQAIGDSGKRQDCIRTVPRRGYRFVGSVVPKIVGGKSVDASWEASSGQEPPSPREPSLVVLPFDNLTGDPTQEHICDGLTETIIAVLSISSLCNVVARNTAFTFKRQAVEVKEITRRLGTRYVMEGSVQKSGKIFRVTVQFIDAIEDKHLWAERYDRELDDIFAVQDDVTSRIAATIGPTLRREYMERAARDGADKTAADLRMRALYHFHRFTLKDNLEARRLAEESIRFEPLVAGGYITLAWTYRRESEWQWCLDPALSLQKASAFARKAVAIDNRHTKAFMVLAVTEAWLGRYESALDALDKSDALDPHWTENRAWRSRILTLAGRHEEAVEVIEKAISLYPEHPSWYEAVLGAAYFGLERFGEAERLLETAVAAFPSHVTAYSMLAASQAATGHLVKARESVDRLLEISPGFSLEHIAYSRPYKFTADRERFADALRKAGLPDA